MQWSDLELARRIQHILFLADREQEEKSKPAEEEAAPPITHLAPQEPAPGFVRFPSHAPESVLPDQVLPHEVLVDEEQPRLDPLDPHPGYRWIR